MPGVVNGGFEDPGAGPGLADGWTSFVAASGGEVADFSGGTDPSTSTEDFDVGWGTDGYLVDADDGPTDLAVFDSDSSPTDTESFNDWNSGKPYLFDVNASIVAQFTADFGPDVYDGEDFDHGWFTSGYLLEPVDFAATFEEDFDIGWNTASPLDDVITGDDALFDGGSTDTESFENAWPDLLFVVNESTDVLTISSMPSFGPPANGFAITIVTDGAYPGGLQQNERYYLILVTPAGSGFTCKLSKTLAGSAVDLTSVGSGSHYLHADPAIYWTKYEE